MPATTNAQTETLLGLSQDVERLTVDVVRTRALCPA